MATPVLVTKLFIPRPRPTLVPRRRLIERLNAELHGSLILISAPAGFGKTTLLSAWVEDMQRPTAWLSLDEGDNDLARFLIHLIAAVQTWVYTSRRRTSPPWKTAPKAGLPGCG
jgi:LuxR family maltose regulon positive regulatory protein